jgi:hypothetical protein
MFPAIVDLYRARNQLRGCLVAAKKVGDNFAKMNSIGARIHMTWSGEFTKRREILNFLLMIGIFWLSLRGVVGQLALKVLLMNFRSHSLHGGQRGQICIGWGWI